MQNGISSRQDVVEHSFNDVLIELGNLDLVFAEHFNQIPIQKGEAQVGILTLESVYSEQTLLQLLVVPVFKQVVTRSVGLDLSHKRMQHIPGINLRLLVEEWALGEVIGISRERWDSVVAQLFTVVGKINELFDSFGI